MSEQSAWSFSDDRGQLSAAGERPSRVLAYVQAGATLWDMGIRPEGIFGSGHDGAAPDPAKSGTLPLDAVDYRGAGAALDVDTLLRGRPGLVVAVSYGGGHVYGLTPETAKHLEEHVPVVVIEVGHARTLGEVCGRFAELAQSLGARTDPLAARGLRIAGERLRAAVDATREGVRVVALSPAGQDRAHVARPGMWPELRVLTEFGVDVVEPAEGPGANWSTVGWPEVAALAPRIVLTDVRTNATPLGEMAASAQWAAVGREARIVPWNPEPVCSPQARARFLARVADALEAVRGD